MTIFPGSTCSYLFLEGGKKGGREEQRVKIEMEEKKVEGNINKKEGGTVEEKIIDRQRIISCRKGAYIARIIKQERKIIICCCCYFLYYN